MLWQHALSARALTTNTDWAFRKLSALVITISLICLRINTNLSSMNIDSWITHVFIPGKNWKLSLAELVSFFEARNRIFAVYEHTGTFFTTSLPDGFDASMIADLGGTIKIGRLAASVATPTVGQAFLKKEDEARAQVRMSLLSSGVIEEMLAASIGKCVFGVSVYCAEHSLQLVSKVMQRFVGSALKQGLAAHGRNSAFMGFPSGRKNPQLTHVEVLRKGLVERRAEVLFCVGRTETAICITIAVHDPFEFQKRDIGRPVQRSIFAMPPRLARIMINQASCTSGKILLDPFCGVGTILQEALLAGAKAIGVDLNPWCVEAARENLGWLKKEYSLGNVEYSVRQGDSRRLADRVKQEVDCIATEPDLGPALRHVPTTPYAKKIIAKLSPLYRDFLGEAYEVLKKGGRLALVTPYVRTRSGKPVSMPVEDMAASVGLKVVYPFQSSVFPRHSFEREGLAKTSSIVDMEERHKIGREIHVFQK